MRPLVVTNQKPIMDAQILERKKHKHNSKENSQTTRGETK